MVKYLLLLVGIVVVQTAAQSDDEVVAKIGNITVSRKEFVERYEMMPQMERQMKNIVPQLKEEVLYGIIFEKLFAEAALERRLDTVEVTKYSLHEFEKMFVRNELYNREVADKAKEKAQKLFSTYLGNATKVFARALYSANEKEIRNFDNLLEKGLPFDSLIVDLPEQMKDTLTFQVGMEDEQLERQIFSLPDGANTKPMHFEDGWYIYHIDKRAEPIFEKSQGWELEYQELKKVAKQRAEREFYLAYMKKLFLNKKTEAKASLLKYLADKIIPLLKAKEKWRKGDDDKFYLAEDDFYNLEQKILSDSISKTYVKFEKKNSTLRDFVRFLNFENPAFKSIDEKHVLLVLHGKTREFIEREILADEGYKLHLEQTKEVQQDYGVWRDFILHQAMQGVFLDSAKVSDEEVAAYYAKRNSKKENEVLVNIVEILNPNLETIDTVLQKIKAGEDIKELAKRYSIREQTKETSGEFGLFATSSFGEIGRVAGTMNIGDIYGPLKVPEGYSVFKLIDKQKEALPNEEEYEATKEKLRRDLAFNKLRNSLINYTVTLANKYGVTINEKILTDTPVTSINAIVYRYFGFGGKMTAVPMMTPFTDWVKSWKHKNVSP